MDALNISNYKQQGLNLKLARPSIHKRRGRRRAGHSVGLRNRGIEFVAEL